MATRAQDRVVVVAPDMEGAGGGKRSKRSNSRVAMVVLACGVVAAAVGWGANAWLGNDATSEATGEDTSEAVQDGKPPFSAAIKGLPNAMSTSRAVEGDAWLDRSNELEWWLDFLPANSFGLVKLHSGKSCDIVGELHWDGVATPGPWEQLNWTSNKWGESFGKVKLDDLPGTYSFAANLERALVVYSETGSPLACGVLAPWEHYADFGVELKVGRGFKSWRSNSGTAGQAILGKNNTLTWALFNLEPNSGGAVSILNGKDCSDPTQKWFSLWWASNEWGVAKDSVLLDQPFYQVVDHAVAIFGSSGNLLSCESLATFVGTVNTRVEDVLDNLVKVEVSHSGASTQKPTTRPTTFSPSSVYRIYSAMLSEYPSTEALCKDAGLQYLDIQALFENNQEELSSRAAEFAEAVAAVQSSTATPYQVKVNNWFIRLKMEQANYLADQSRLSSLTSQWCNYCATRNDTIKEYERISTQASAQATELQTSYNAIVSISEEVRTAEQKANVSEYQRLTTLLNYCEDVIDEATSEYVESCRSYDICHNSDPLLGNQICERFFCLKQEVEIGLLAVSLTEVRKTLFNEREQFNAALASTQAGTATLADDARVQRYNTLVANKTQAEAELALLKRRLQNDVTCTIPQGTLTLEASNIIQWFLSNLSLESTGSIQIFEGQDCRSIETPLRVGTVTNPSGITWKTQPNATISTGLEDLSLVPENPSFQEISAHSLAVLYNSFGQPIACAPFTVLS